MSSHARPWPLLLATLLLTACPTRTVYYDAGAGGGGGAAGQAGGGAGAPVGGNPGMPGAAGSAGIVSVGGAGGHATNTACDATSCPTGCCTAAGACVLYASESNTTCGSSGAACSACPTGTSCNTAGGICQGCGTAVAITEANIGFPGGGGDAFGQAVALRNGGMLVGAPNAAGGVGRVYAFSGSGSSYSYLEFVAPNSGTVSTYARGLGLDRMGTNAFVAGTVSGMPTNWLFARTGANWFVGSSLSPPESASGAAIDLGNLVVGGSFAAYVYDTGGGGQQTLTPSDFVPSNTNGYFGPPVAISGNTILVTAEPFDAGLQFGHFAYIFGKSGSSWVQQAKLVPNDLASSNNPHFHFTVALEGATAVLATSAGAYVFRQVGSDWTQVQKILPPSDRSEFGAAVDMSGDTMVIGAISGPDAGAAYVYGRSGESWIQGPTLGSRASADGFGAAVAVSGGTVAVGSSGSGSDGAVYLFACPPGR